VSIGVHDLGGGFDLVLLTLRFEQVDPGGGCRRSGSRRRPSGS
jgi:hypothetical protein